MLPWIIVEQQIRKLECLFQCSFFVFTYSLAIMNDILGNWPRILKFNTMDFDGENINHFCPEQNNNMSTDAN